MKKKMSNYYFLNFTIVPMYLVDKWAELLLIYGYLKLETCIKITSSSSISTSISCVTKISKDREKLIYLYFVKKIIFYGTSFNVKISSTFCPPNNLRIKLQRMNHNSRIIWIEFILEQIIFALIKKINNCKNVCFILRWYIWHKIKILTINYLLRLKQKSRSLFHELSSSKEKTKKSIFFVFLPFL